MKKRHVITALGVGLVLCMLAVGGCDRIGGFGKAKYQRTVRQAAAAVPGTTVVAETRVGSISIRGTETTDCNVVGDIEVHAPTAERAKQIAEEVTIGVEPDGKRLIVKAEYPEPGRGCSVSVSFEITVPRETAVECRSAYGSVKVANIKADVKGTSGSGSVSGEDIEGSVMLGSDYGAVGCRNATGATITLKSTSGSVTAENIKGTLEAASTYGSITCRDISGGDMKIKAKSGRITVSKASLANCDASTSYGAVSVENLSGKDLKLNSGSGSIEVAESSADKASITSSYGGIRCQQVNCADLTAKTGSGNISVTYSQSAPSEIAASIGTAYGNIDFAAPRGFAGQAELSTSYGSIKTDLPIKVTGQTDGRRLAGSIGEGKGTLRLQTKSGSIKLR